jgi:hypothetical protein
MNTEDDGIICDIIKRSPVGPFLVSVRPERDADLTTATFRRRSGDYFDESEGWDTESTVESIAQALIDKATNHI